MCSNTKIELGVLESSFFQRAEYPKTAAIYAKIRAEVTRLQKEAPAKAGKITEACKAAEQYCIKVVGDGGAHAPKTAQDEEIAGYLLAFTREPLKYKRSIFASQSWTNVTACVLEKGIVPPGVNIDRFLDGIVMKIDSTGKAPDASFSLVSLTPSFPEFLKATSAIDSEYKPEGGVSQPIRHIKGFESRFPDEIMKFNVVGCQGVSGLSFVERMTFSNMQQEVAKHMNKNDAQFNILLGDNIYNTGVKVQNEIASFEENFHKIYNKFSFVILGNHDYGIGGGVSLSAKGYLKSWNKAAEQINHTRNGRNWYMPHRYYAVVCKHAIFYCIDSNAYFLDPDQQKWLQGATQFLRTQYSERWHILCSHHPLESYGKRGWGADGVAGDDLLRSKEEEQGGKRKSTSPVNSPQSETMRYTGSFSASQSAKKDSDEEPDNTDEYLACLFPQACSMCRQQSMSTAIREQLVKDQINFDVVFAAHDHFFAAGKLLDENLFTFQVIIGCGGKRLQSVKFEKILKKTPDSFSNLERVAFEKYGFLRVEITDNLMHLEGIDDKGQIFYRNTLLLSDFR